MGFLNDLIEKTKSFLGAPPPAPTEVTAVEHDRFDDHYWSEVRHTVPPVNKLVNDLSLTYDYVEEFAQDVFNLAYRVDPKIRPAEEMKPSHVVNREIVEQIENTPQFEKLRLNTAADEYGSALALLGMESAIREAQQYAKEAREKAKEAEEEQKKADEQQQQVQDACGGVPGFDPNAQGPTPDPNGQPGGPGQGQAIAAIQQALQQAQAAQQQAQQAQQQAQAQAQQAAQQIASKLATSAGQVDEEINEEKQLMNAFGVADGELQKMDFNERRTLAQRLRNNRLAKFYKLLGQFRMVQQSESRRKVMHATDEVVGVKLGNNLQRMIPAEMLNLATPELEDDFWMRYANHEILEYDVRGTEKLGQGAVICVVDESGSMTCEDCAGGSREAWSKALALALADQARQKGRDFYYIGFSSSRQQWTLKLDKGEAPIHKVIEMTEHFFSGGTEYERPLSMALDILEEDFTFANKPKPDVVFITDDEYGSLTPDFLERWNAVKEKTNLRCWGIALGCSYSGALEVVADNVRALGEMMEDADPRVMADMFRTV